MIEFIAAVAGAVLVLGAAYLGGRAFRRMSSLPVARTFRAYGTAKGPTLAGLNDPTVRIPGRHRAPDAPGGVQ